MTPQEYAVKATQWALRETRKLFQRDEHRLAVIDQLKLLRFWPPHMFEAEAFARDLDMERISYCGAEFYEYRLKGKQFGGNGNLRVFFFVDDEHRTIWIIHGYWKKTDGRIEDHVLTRVARRVRELQGAIQDGSMYGND